MRISQWQCARSSLVSPNFSDPNSRATGADRICLRIITDPRPRGRRAWARPRCPSEVVPTTRAQSATASASDRNSSADSRISRAQTADRASRNATSYGFTTRSRENPKLNMARAAAPIFNGLREETRTTRRLDRVSGEFMKRPDVGSTERVKEFGGRHPCLFQYALERAGSHRPVHRYCDTP